MRTIAALALLATSLSIPAFGQATWKASTFTSPDGAFRFVYPTDFQVCMKGDMQSCNFAYIPVCDEDALVCAVYPGREFKDTNFGAASFQVREILTSREMMTADVCVTPFPRKDNGTVTDWPDFLISAEHLSEMIGGLQFVHGISGGAATSRSIGIDLYRRFYKQRCFQLSVSVTETNPNVSDPPMKTLTPVQQKKLDQTMSDILHSFRLIK
jgi:hypothetical protein